MGDIKNKKSTQDLLDQKYDKETRELILKTVSDLLSRLDLDLAENLVFSAIKLNGTYFADIVDTVNEAQKRRHLITLMKTTDKTEIFDAALEDCKFYGYTY